MRDTHSTTRLLVLLCLFAFQSQTLAAVWLPCKHASATVAVADCPMHATARTATHKIDGEQVFDCAKCALAVAIGVVHVLPPAVVVRCLSAGSDHPAHLAGFYRQIFPERAARPPNRQIA